MTKRMEYIFCSILRDSLSEEEFTAICIMTSADWSSIYVIARYNNLLALLYYKLKSHKISLPAEWEEKLRDSYLACSRKDIQRHKQLCELIKTFNDNGIEHIILKGSHLAEKVYIHSLLRPMCDIDILVKDEDIEKAFTILISKGYYNDSQHGNSNIVRDVYVHHYPLLEKNGSFPVELHRYLFESNKLKNLDLVWLRVHEVSIGGKISKVMTNEDLLIYVALHGLKEHTQKLGINFVYDLHTIISAGNINWTAVAELIKDGDWGNSKTLYSSLIIAKHFFHTDIPSDFLTNIRPVDFNQNIQTTIEELILNRQTHSQTEAYTFSYYLFHALKNMSFKNIARQSFFSPEQISSEARSRYKGWRIIVLYLRSVSSIFATFIKIIYRYIFTGSDELKISVRAGRKAVLLTHWLES